MSRKESAVAGEGGPAPAAPPEGGTAAVDFAIGGQHIHADITLPPGPIRTRQLLPLAQALTTIVVDQGVKDAAARGESVSCKKGCGACCRQLVPITQPEARHIRDLVEHLPAPRRARVRARFAQARQHFLEAGLLETLQHLDQVPETDVEALSVKYFRLHVACPFLEGESCSIHPDRPLICREYLVTSPPEACAVPAEGNVRGVPLAGRVSTAFGRLGETHPSRRGPLVLLALAPEWADVHPDEPPPRPGPELLRELFGRLAEKKDT